MYKKYCVCGIICEYNPFHNGHILHIQKAKELCNPDILIAVMSGNFVQRGEPAIINKWERAKVALEYGVDIVLELPFPYAIQSANYFAKGAVDVLKLAAVQHLVFGSETNDIEQLKTYAMQTDILDKTQGISTAKAYEHLYGTAFSPNDILGINYLKQLQGSSIQAHTIKRTNKYHEISLQGEISSATSIRACVYHNEDYHFATPMQNLPAMYQMQYYYPYIKMLLLTSDPETLASFFLMDEGIEHLLIKNAKAADSYDAFIALCTSKRYTKASINRTLIHLMTQTKKATINTLPPINYLRVLAFNEKGKAYLHYLKKDVFIASKFTKIPSPYKEMELKATRVYNFPLPISKQRDMINLELQPPIFTK